MLKYGFLLFCWSANSFLLTGIKKKVALPVLHVVITGINTNAGVVRVAIYDKAENFYQ